MNKVRISIKRKNILKYQIEITECKNTITILKNSIEGFNSRLVKQKEESANSNPGSRIHLGWGWGTERERETIV